MNDVAINDKQHFKVATQNFLYDEDTLVGTKMYQGKTISQVKQEMVLSV